MSSSKDSCAACKYLRKKCTEKCIFAPYFPPDYDSRQRFIKIHRAFGAGQVVKLLKKIHPYQRKYAIHSLHYEAKTRLQDPIDSCLGRVSILRNMLQQWRHFVKIAKDELATYTSSQAMLPILQHTPGFPHQYAGNASSSAHAMQYMTPKMGIPAAAATAALAFHWGNLVVREPQEEQFFEAQQLRNAVVAARELQEMFRGYEQQHPHRSHHSSLADEPQKQHQSQEGQPEQQRSKTISSNSKSQEARGAGA